NTVQNNLIIALSIKNQNVTMIKLSEQSDLGLSIKIKKIKTGYNKVLPQAGLILHFRNFCLSLKYGILFEIRC
ncbi:hypothetical protein PG637_11050, partial [Riemerella anatipestifer]|nr:hypothetical protein [Riemerella anatipestifer]MDY3326198.1 hypothetical protein [Riemerella anatipestifer]MDY3354548.1 hypothetical protein [Riemerella anatipestifer]